MKNRLFYKTASFTLIALCLIFSACKSSVEIKANADTSCQISAQLESGKIISSAIEEVLQTFSFVDPSSSYVTKEVSIFSAQDIKEALSMGMSDVKVTTDGKENLSISGRLPEAGKQNATLDNEITKAANFLACTKSSLTLILSRENIQNLVSSLPEETKSFVSLLMPPVLDEEEMSKEEYINLLSTVYGNNIAEEINKAVIKVSLLPPEGKSILKSSSDDKNAEILSNRATFSLPLVTLLTLEETKTFSIIW